MIDRTDLRNIAIVAHVDHGKTTLVDGLLRQSKVFRVNQQVAERVMDSNDLERERGITILAKNTAISIWDPVAQQQVKINIVDTPGHADFGGEVERVMNMVDGVLLLVDAAEGPMPQTRFVLKQALQMGHRAIVVVNKVDRKDADPADTLNKTFDLFLELGATDEQADFPVIYANAVSGQAGTTPDLGPDLQPLFDTILRYIPPPRVDVDAPFQMLVSMLGYNQYRGTTAIGRIFAGTLHAGDAIARVTADGQILAESAPRLCVFHGLEQTEVEAVQAGDIAVITGLEGIAIGETLASPDAPQALPRIEVGEPTVRMMFGVNTSPLSGIEGQYSTSRKLRERLYNELRTNVALHVEDSEHPDTFIVSGRGELHLAILVETMRREGYEFQVSRPEVVLREGKNGETLEPFETVYIDAPAETTGPVMEMLAQRQGRMLDMENTDQGRVKLTYLMPTRGLFGLRYHLLTATRGLGVMNTIFYDYLPQAGPIAARTNGSLVAWEAGTTTGFGIENAQLRGITFVEPGDEVYEGMVVGERPQPGDLPVNIAKKKELTNVRSETKETFLRLSPPRKMSLDEAIEYLADDELLEVTPLHFRIRKRILDSHMRRRQEKRAKKEAEVRESA